MRGSSSRGAFLAAASLILAGCGGALPGSGGMLSGDGGSPTGGRGGRAAGGTIGSGTGGVIPPGADCGAVTSVSAKPIPADVLIVLDASDSMNDDSSGGTCNGGCGASSKWAQAVAAIERLVADTETTANWGLQIFPDPGSACGVGSGDSVPVSPGQAAAIGRAIAARTSPNGGVIAGGNAPIRGAVDGAAAYLAGLTDVSPKIILLATAGAPRCMLGGGDTGADDSAGSVQAITNASTAGITTYVLGVATPGGAADGTLSAMAIAGGWARPGSPSYTPVANIADLTTSIQTLLQIDWSCVLAVPPPPTADGTTSRGYIRVLLDGAEIPRDPSHTNGWDFVDATFTSLQLSGPACVSLTSPPPHMVSIVFRCNGLQ